MHRVESTRPPPYSTRCLRAPSRSESGIEPVEPCVDRLHELRDVLEVAVLGAAEHRGSEFLERGLAQLAQPGRVERHVLPGLERVLGARVVAVAERAGVAGADGCGIAGAAL